MSKNISISVNRSDSHEKLRGTASYIDDMDFKDMLFAKTVRSTKARAIIKEIILPDLPEGYYIVDKNDIPAKNILKVILDDQPIFAEYAVQYIGEPILLVVGPDREHILNIISKITITYEVIEGVFELCENKCLKPIFGENNVFFEYQFEKGSSFNEGSGCGRVFEETFETGYQEHMYMEPQGFVACYDNDICTNNYKLTVYGSMQCPFYVKNALMTCFGFSEDRIRVIQTTTGGAFGGKEDYPSMIACHAALAAYKTKKPVKIVYDREEDVISTSKRHPSKITYKTFVDDNNRIEAMEIDIKLDGGAYSGLSGVVLQRSMFAASGVYDIKNLKVCGKVFATNHVPSGAFRGFGAPQAFFAIEMHMNNIATKLNMDPIDFKQKHFVQKGDQTSTSGRYRYDVKLNVLMDKVLEMSGYREKIQKYQKNQNQDSVTFQKEPGISDDNKEYQSTSDKLMGMGVSFFFHGCGFTGSGEKDHIKATVKLQKNSEGTVTILVSNVEMGQGLSTSFRKIVATALDIEIERVLFQSPDTDIVPDSGPTVASRSIMVVGKLIEDAARKMKEGWDDAPKFVIEENYQQPEFIKWDQLSFKGDAYPTYSWGVNVAEVLIDPITYEVVVANVWAGFDIGTTIDDRMLKGQIDGGILQGIGYATIEVLQARKGALLQKNFTDYIIPTSVDATDIHSFLIDNPYEFGPFGAKGAGELTLIGAAPAVAAAISNAIGLSITQIPVTPEYLLKEAQWKKT